MISHFIILHIMTSYLLGHFSLAIWEMKLELMPFTWGKIFSYVQPMFNRFLSRVSDILPCCFQLKSTGDYKKKEENLKRTFCEFIIGYCFCFWSLFPRRFLFLPSINRNCRPLLWHLLPFLSLWHLPWTSVAHNITVLKG